MFMIIWNSNIDSCLPFMSSDQWYFQTGSHSINTVPHPSPCSSPSHSFTLEWCPRSCLVSTIKKEDHYNKNLTFDLSKLLSKLKKDNSSCEILAHVSHKRQVSSGIIMCEYFMQLCFTLVMLLFYTVALTRPQTLHKS